MSIERKISKCRSCEATIVWCVNERGKRVPVDADPVAGGNMRIIHNPIPNVRLQPDIELFSDDDDGVRYVTHFMTCPHADEWRKAYE